MYYLTGSQVTILPIELQRYKVDCSGVGPDSTGLQPVAITVPAHSPWRFGQDLNLCSLRLQLNDLITCPPNHIRDF